ncbi:glycogen synthase GlgA [uncultured Parolsenella sp.]|uniref:glycogen synthase GlgA n=1 Tax=uncultured Parolsenella sp. TaxID=2083008 RepID=UPI0025D2BE23|nr:glycogen synthase GlgA [uncultured Parolsenella sp.]
MSGRTRRKLKILFAASEAAPFVKTGGLGDVAGSLPHELRRCGAKVSVILPKYRRIPAEFRDRMRHVTDFYLNLGWRNVWCGVDYLKWHNIDYYFIDNEDYFGRDTIYGDFDDGERFAFFSKAITECIGRVKDLHDTDVLHCNDWQTALSCVFLREFYKGLPYYDNVKTVFSIHNVKFQGQYGDDVMVDICGLADTPAAAQMYVGPKTINFMKGALLYADTITTVSPTYAEELKLPFYGEGLEDIFRERAWKLHGILNGIDTEEFNPRTDAQIVANYSEDDLAGKAACKEALQRELGLDPDPTRPLCVMVSRLTKQKGCDLVQYALGQLLDRSVQVAVLGTGDHQYEDSLRYFDWKYKGHMVARIDFDLALSHRMYAGADIFLMPSQFEPCGLSQMIAMRYGALPVVRETGGLKDSVVPYNKFTGEGTGFSFANFNGDEFAAKVLEACEVFWTDRDAWSGLVRNAMEADFGWRRSANQYLDVYHQLHPEVIPYNKKRSR